MVKIKEVEVTNSELDAIEDLAVAWTLCQKHTRQSLNKKDVEIYAIQYSCKACQKLSRAKSSRALHLWSKLVHAYEITRYGKCSCGLLKPTKHRFYEIKLEKHKKALAEAMKNKVSFSD